jgi:FkbM family methyltransferase
MRLGAIRRAVGLGVRRLRGAGGSGAWEGRGAALRLASEIARLDGGAVTYLDVGSAGAPDLRWQHMIDAGAVKAVLVDMVEDWARMPSVGRGQVTTVRAALADENRDATVYVTRHPACTSCLRPNTSLLAEYPVREWFTVVREEPVRLQRYDEVASARGLPQPEIAKVDVQGLEGRVLRGMGDVLDGVVCLELECQLRQLYEGQDTFMALYEYLTSRGFTLRDLKPQGPFEGEALEFNALWSRRPATARGFQIVKLWEMATGVWVSQSFESIDAHQRRFYHFNE